MMKLNDFGQIRDENGFQESKTLYGEYGFRPFYDRTQTDKNGDIYAIGGLMIWLCLNMQPTFEEFERRTLKKDWVEFTTSKRLAHYYDIAWECLRKNGKERWQIEKVKEEFDKLFDCSDPNE